MMGEFHWFCSNNDGWGSDDKLEKALHKCTIMSVSAGNCNIWRVPGTNAELYSIVDFKPDVEGIDYIGKTKI